MTHEERYRLLAERAERLECEIEVIRKATAENVKTDQPVLAGRRLERAHVAALVALKQAKAVSAIVGQALTQDDDDAGGEAD